LGFDKLYLHDLEIMRRFRGAARAGVSPSCWPPRARTISGSSCAYPGRAAEGTAAAVAAGVFAGANVLRVHDVAFMARFRTMLELLTGRVPPPPREEVRLWHDDGL